VGGYFHRARGRTPMRRQGPLPAHFDSDPCNCNSLTTTGLEDRSKKARAIAQFSASNLGHGLTRDMGRPWTHVDRTLWTGMGHSLTNADGAFPALRHVAYMDRARAARASAPAALDRMCWHD
jgi:hypothetical protein